MGLSLSIDLFIQEKILTFFLKKVFFKNSFSISLLFFGIKIIKPIRLVVQNQSLFLLTNQRNKTLFVFKVFADWQKSELGKLALSRLALPDLAGPPFNDLTNNPFSTTQEMTINDILDYQSKLGYRYDNEIGKDKMLPMEDPFVEDKIRYYKVRSYVGIIVPYQASGLFNFRICYQQPKCKSGEIALFGDVTEPRTKSVSIDKDHFTYAKALISNDDSRKIKVGLKMIFG